MAVEKKAAQSRIEQLNSEFTALNDREKSYILGFSRGLACAVKKDEAKFPKTQKEKANDSD